MQQFNRKNRPLRNAAVFAVAAATAMVGVSVPAGAAGAEFACDPGFYQVIGGQLAELDPANETYATIGPTNSSYNAMGYRIADGYLYGMRGTTLQRVDNTGTVTDIAQLDVRSGAYTGDFDDEGLLNISRGGRDWYKVDVDTLEITPVAEFNAYTAVADITNVHGVFFGVSSDGTLYSYDQTSLETKEIGMISGLPETLKAYGAAWSTAGGNLYVGRNSGEIYQITGYTTSTPKATLVGRAPATSSNDGSSCSLAVPIPGLNDVDGPEPESPPRTEEATEASEYYTENYDEISQTFTPIPESEPEPEPEPEPETDDSTYAFQDAGLGTGPSCEPGADVDRLDRGPVNDLISVTDQTELYRSSFNGDSLNDWIVRSGSWSSTDGALIQHNICGYDYTVLLDGYSVDNFRMEATFSALSDVNNGGILFNHASTRSRSGAVVIDLADDGQTLRWGEYDKLGYYQQIGSTPITAPAASQQVTLAAVVHGNQVSVQFNGTEVGTFTSTETGGMVGLITSVSQISYSEVSLAALPALSESASESVSESQTTSTAVGAEGTS